MIVLVCGGRDFNSARHRKKIFETLSSIAPKHIITGCSTGVDAHTRDYIDRKDMRGSIFEANWELHGRAAGPLRNKEMIEYVKNHPKYKLEGKLVVAFWDGRSRGTKSTIALAQAAGLKVLQFDMQVHAVTKFTKDMYDQILQEFIDHHKKDPYFDLRLGQWMLTHDILKVGRSPLYSSIFVAERTSHVTRLLVENGILEL